jgi:hypothetical protein
MALDRGKVGASWDLMRIGRQDAVIVHATTAMLVHDEV